MKNRHSHVLTLNAFCYVLHGLSDPIRHPLTWEDWESINEYDVRCKMDMHTNPLQREIIVDGIMEKIDDKYFKQKSMKNISSATYELAKILMAVTSSQLRSDVLMKEKEVHGQAKHFIRTSIYNRLTAIINDVRNLLGNNPEDLKAMEEDILSHEAALQVENIVNLTVALPKGIRDEIELYVEQRYHVYGNKAA